MPLFDTHAHLEDEQIAPILAEVLANARESNLVGITAIGTDVRTSRDCLDLANQHSIVHAAVGLHPNNCKTASEDDWTEIVRLSREDNVVAIGETGLDRHWDYCPFDVQEKWFTRHIELSFDTEKPLVIHMRDCEEDVLRTLEANQRNGKIIGIMHSFAGQWLSLIHI